MSEAPKKKGAKRKLHWSANLSRVEPLVVQGAPVPAAPSRADAPPEGDAMPEGAALLEGLSDLRHITLLGPQGLPAALAACARWDCAVTLLDLSPEGKPLAQPSPWLSEAHEALCGAGVPESQIARPDSLKRLKPADLVLAQGTFGDAWKIKHLEPLLPLLLHADSRMILDIRKGSGAFPFLRGRGEVAVLGREGEATLSRVSFAPAPPAASGESWADIAQSLMGPGGFYREHPTGHSFLFLPRDPKVLVVTFDNLDIAMGKREDRRPWGFEFIEKQGWSMLGVMAGGWTWYREPWVVAEFERLRDEGFFARFERVVFYGASMGGYAAAAFSRACPGADVVAISPQSTLDKRLVPWETRYKAAWDRDFSGPFGDAPEASAEARRVVLLFDPFEPLDSGHITRFTGPNVVKLRAPLMGHRLGSSLNQMGILSPVILGALDGTLTESAFYQLLRKRRTHPRYHKELFDKLVARGHPKLARRFGAWVLRQGDNRHVRRALAELG